MEEFFDIKINDFSIKELSETKGELSSVIALLGSPVSSEVSDDSKGPFFANFRYEGVEYYFAGYNQRNLSGFKITKSNITLTIQDKTIKVGDHVFQKLGNDIKQDNRKDGDKSIVFDFFGSSEFISIQFNKETKIVTKITYIVLT